MLPPCDLCTSSVCSVVSLCALWFLCDLYAFSLCALWFLCVLCGYILLFSPLSSSQNTLYNIPGTSMQKTLIILIASLMLFARMDNPIPRYSQLNARAIGMGSAMTAVSGDPQCLFYNPAGLASVRRFTVSQSHSLRHFPGEIRNLDQLDADPVSITAPLMPYGIYSSGFVIQGECGYDYLIRNDESFPKRRFWGTERYDGYAGYVTPWTKLGMYHRSHQYKSITERGMPPSEGIQYEGEGGCFGIIQSVLPGLDYGNCSEKMDDDYSTGTGKTTTRKRTGWSFRPLPWIHYASDTQKIKTKQRFEDDVDIQSDKQKNWGLELSPLPWITCRFGCINGKRTSGLSLNLGQVKLHYGEAKDFMPEIIGDDYPDKFKDFHCASYQVSL
jgi:hypothetical protein